MTLLLRATGPALISWPVFLVVVLGSAQMAAVGTGTMADGGVITLALVGASGGLVGYLVMVAAWMLFLRHLSGLPRLGGAVAAAALAGLSRGMVVMALLTALGLADLNPDNIALRLTTGILVGIPAFLVSATGVAAVRHYRESSQLLIVERNRLMELLNASSEGIAQQQTETLSRVQARLEEELRCMRIESAPSAVSALEDLAGDVVRPLSHSLARDLPPWDERLPTGIPRVSLIDVLRDPVPSAAIHPVLTMGILFVVTLPSALLVYEPAYGLAAMISGLATLGLVLAAGRAWIRRHPPQTSVTGWLCIATTILGGTLAGVIVSAVVDLPDPSAGVFPRLALVSVPVLGVMIAVVSMLSVRMHDVTSEYEDVTRLLRWNLARVNTQQWEQNGQLSRALHGPVQSLLHSRLLRLRQMAEAGPVPAGYLDSLREELQDALAQVLAPPDAPRPIREVLMDVCDTWEGVASITIDLSPAAEAGLAEDPLCAHAMTDLATEAVSNSVRHGRASQVDVTIDVDQSQNLMVLHVVDDGTASTSSSPGLGTTLLTRCAYDWSLSCERPTTLTARLPWAAAPQRVTV